MKNFFIVAIGASGGGVLALTRFFEHIPANCPVAFVVVTHIKRDFHSKLDHMIARYTEMPVIKVTESIPLEPGKIYVMAEKIFMTIKSDKLITRERLPSEIINNAVNIFMESLAEDAAGRAIGIILSGSGTDGLSGVKAIERNGGYIMVQSPNEAQFGQMPSTVITNDKPKYVSTAARLADHLIAYISKNQLDKKASNPPDGIKII